MATAGGPPTEINPTAKRLLETAKTTFETMRIEVDPQVMEVVRSLAETGAQTLKEEGRAGDAEAIRAAEARLVYVLTTASLQEETSELSLDYLHAFPNRGTTLEASSLTGFLDGICPLWPFCA